MRPRLLAAALSAAVLAAPALSHAGLPPEILSAGVTEAAWNGVRLQVQRAATEKHVSERALGGVCLKMGIELARSRRLDLSQLIALIDSRADEINALQQRLASEAEGSDPATAGLLQRASAAIDAGELDQADQLPGPG